MNRTRNPRLVAAACVVAWLLTGGCSTGTAPGQGSETHFVCERDPDCLDLGEDYRCVARRCTPVADAALAESDSPILDSSADTVIILPAEAIPVGPTLPPSCVENGTMLGLGSLVRGCVTDEDCTLVAITTCCDEERRGITRSAACIVPQPVPCESPSNDCVPRYLTDDGRIGQSETGIAVRCDHGLCTSHGLCGASAAACDGPNEVCVTGSASDATGTCKAIPDTCGGVFDDACARQMCGESTENAETTACTSHDACCMPRDPCCGAVIVPR